MKIENVVCVDAKGLQLKEDNLHLTTEAQVQLGHMLADAYLNNFATSSASPPWMYQSLRSTRDGGRTKGQFGSTLLNK